MALFTNIIKLFREKFLPFLRDPLFISRWVSRWRETEPNRITARVTRGYKWVGHNYHGDIFMFEQDMHQGIMPFRHIAREGPQFDVIIEPGNPAVQDMIVEALGQPHYRHNLADALCDFIRDAAHSLFVYGRIVYEIVFEKDPEGKITNFKFANVHPLSIKRFFGSYYQIIPWWVAKDSHVKVGIRRIFKHKMMLIDFPEELGGRGALKKILKRLSFLSKEVIPKFHMEAIQNNRDIGFDLTQYIHSKYIEKAQLTARFGWHQRKIPDEEILEFYSIYRHLKFASSQAIIREHILDSINKALNGPILNLGARIVMQGIQSSAQIKSEFNTLHDGDLKFVELFKRTNI